MVHLSLSCPTCDSSGTFPDAELCTSPRPFHNFVCVWFVSQTRAKPVLDLLQDIVMQSTSKLAKAADVKRSDPSAVYTPFAVSTFNAEMEWSRT